MLLQEYLVKRDSNSLELISLIVDRLNAILINQIDELDTQKQKINYWQHPIEALNFKLSSHAASMRNLLLKSSMPYKGIHLKIIDISSINILTRAIIENYLTLFHFHYEAVDDSRKEFRFLIYVLSALKNRKLFSSSLPETQTQQIKDVEEIKKFQTQLNENKYFQSLPFKNQTHYLTTKEAKQLNWVTLLDNCDLNPLFFKDIWRLLSNYAHSEFLSILQIREQAKNPVILSQNANLMSTLTCIVLAASINHLGKLFKSSQEIINALSAEDKEIFDYFLAIGRKGSA